MTKFTKTLFILGLFFTTSCGIIEPKPFAMTKFKDGSPEFNAGWDHGCQSGMSTYGNFFQKAMHDFYQDYNMLSNQDYNVAWHEAFNFCRHYNLKWNVNEW